MKGDRDKLLLSKLLHTSCYLHVPVSGHLSLSTDCSISGSREGVCSYGSCIFTKPAVIQE